LIYEVKYGAAVLDITDRQNAYNIIITIKRIIKLFKVIKREKKLYQEILAFPISYNYNSVRIYGYYPIIEEDKTTFYYYLINKFDFIIRNSKEK